MKLIDSSAWIEFLRGTNSEAASAVHSALASGSAGWCDVVVLELFNGASSRDRWKIEELDQVVVSLEINKQVWKLSRRAAINARTRGISVPVPDLLIFACALVHSVEIIHHGDEHFELLSELNLKIGDS